MLSPNGMQPRRAGITLLLVAQACSGGSGDGGDSGGGGSATVEREPAGATSATTPAGGPSGISAGATAAADRPLVTVYKSPTCGCCTAWVEHLAASGFRVVSVEGHVPAPDIRRLLSERPSVTGLAVPGMPQGSPGMETGVREPYEVLAFSRDGRTSVFARH